MTQHHQADEHHPSHRIIRISECDMNKRKRVLRAIVLIADIALTLYTKRKKQKQAADKAGFLMGEI